MAGNPKDSEWFSTARAKRKRKGTEVMLSDGARERLDKMSEARKQPKSQIVEELILAAPIRAPKPASSGEQ